MTKQFYASTRRELLSVIDGARAVQERARNEGKPRAKALTAEIIFKALGELVALRSAYYRTA